MKGDVELHNKNEASKNVFWEGTGLQILMGKGVILVPCGYLRGLERAGWDSQSVALPQLLLKTGFTSKPRSPGLIQ